jgi:hypothetical protein
VPPPTKDYPTNISKSNRHLKIDFLATTSLVLGERAALVVALFGELVPVWLLGL